MEIIHIPQVFTLWTNRVETKGTKRCGGKLIALTRYNKSLLLPRWGLKLDTIPLWCFCGQKIQNHVPSLVKISDRKGTHFKKSVFCFLLLKFGLFHTKLCGPGCQLVYSDPGCGPTTYDFLTTFTSLFRLLWSWIYPNPDLPLGLTTGWSWCYMTGTSACQGKYLCLNKFYRGKIIWMYRQYIEYHGMTRCEVDIKKNNAD